MGILYLAEVRSCLHVGWECEQIVVLLAEAYMKLVDEKLVVHFVAGVAVDGVEVVEVLFVVEEQVEGGVAAGCESPGIQLKNNHTELNQTNKKNLVDLFNLI